MPERGRVGDVGQLVGKVEEEEPRVTTPNLTKTSESESGTATDRPPPADSRTSADGISFSC